MNLAQPFTTPLFLTLLALQFSGRGSDEGDGAKNGPFPYVALCALALILLIAAAP